MTVGIGYPTEIHEQGAGPPVVLVHGTPLDAGAWTAVARALENAHRVVTYDLRGHGTARATPVPGSYDVLADDLARLLDGLGVERAHVAGHSFGGQVAMTFAGRHPERLSALTVVCARTTPHPPFAAAADVVERDGIEAVAAGALARWFTPAALEEDTPAVPYARGCLVPAAAPALVAAFRLIAAFDLGDRLAALPVPARFVAAERDAVATPDDLRGAASTTPDGSFRLEPGMGHMLPVERPDRLARLSW